MKTIILLLLPLTLLAQNTPKKLLSDALFAEEADQDLPTAITKYQAVLDQYDQHRAAAGLALLRLAEINRKQGNKQTAAGLYTRLLTEFPNLKPHTTTARKQLLALGKKLPATPNNTPDPEAQELARLKKLATTSPDILHRPETLNNAAKNGWLTVVRFLIKDKIDPNKSDALALAAQHGHSEICEYLLRNAPIPKVGVNSRAVETALRYGNTETFKVLLENGAPVSNQYQGDRLAEGILGTISYITPDEVFKQLLNAGFDINYTPKSISVGRKGQRTTITASLLHQAVFYNRHDLIDFLLSNNANVNVAGSVDKIAPIHLAAKGWNTKTLKKLIDAGAKINEPIVGNQPFFYKDGNRTFDEFKIVHLTPLQISIFSTSETTLQLLRSGAKIPKGTITLLARRGLTEGVAFLIKAGHNVNDATFSYRTPLWEALDNDHFKTAELLLENGAQLKPTDIYKAPISIREPWVRNNIYPALNNRSGITFSIPALNWHTTLLEKPGSYSDLAQALLFTRSPSRIMIHSRQIGDRKGAWVALSAPHLKWSIYRKGKSIPLDFGKDTLPKLKSGDIIEVTDLAPPSEKPSFSFARPKDQQPPENFLITDNLAHLPPTPVTIAIRKLISVPITIKTPQTTLKLNLKGNLAVYDPRSNEMPTNPLAEVLNKLGYVSSNFTYAATIERRDESILSIHHRQATNFILERGDIIILKRTLSMRSRPTITNSERSFFVYAPTFRGTNYTLLQALTFANSGYPYDEYLGPPDYYAYNLSKLSKKITQPEVLTKHLRTFKWQKTILPNIDLSNIRIFREKEPKVLKVNLNKKIEVWDGSSRSARMADIDLQSGDIIEIDLLEGPWSGYTPQQNEFFKAALKYHITIIDDQGKTTEVNLGYTPPEWIQTPLGLIPLQKMDTVSSLLGRTWLARGENIIIGRDGKRIPNVDRNSYWPRNHDQINVTR